MEILVLFKMCIEMNNGSQEHAFLQYLDVTRLIDLADETLAFVCLR